MAPGTRTPNGRKLTNECAGLPRDLNTGIAAKTLAEPGGCLLARPNTGTDTKHQTQKHWSQAFNAEHSGDLGVATKEPRKGRPAATGRELLRLVNWK